MSKRPFPVLGDSIPPIGQGTWQMEYDDKREAIAALRKGLDSGLTHVDTAELYGSGSVEQLVGEAIAGRRDEVFLVSKVMPSNASRAGTIRACERSLRRLQTDRLDLYLLHWPGSHPLHDTIAAFEELREAGKIRAFGVSNFDERELASAIAIAGEGRIACNQVLYHLEERAIERRVLPFCEKHAIAVVGYSPFGSGRFPNPHSAGGKTLSRIAQAHGASERQVALSFLVRRNTLFTIPKSSRADHVSDNAGALRLALGDDEISEIEKAFPLGPDRRGIPTL